ncbi:DUF3139 domain-containing protein [Paenibacillus sp. 3LSP]|uniref:DUF3139 domain-containing protein n=2 Tax=Paenibacillus TaxID=44249 RepID=A0A3S8RTQ9_9BACL|nr:MULTISPECIES: DUF3139 domain-containing protein [Paenibacillus]AZK46515.1 DUF3139 domain-containing protein [Paenibacillus lentus]MDU0331163.1 DUF3139 domain-containing protein [Paenibacillus sp. 3LSP]GIO38111.1 hypothetical protein J41TS12_29720 [Paenibacillus antibioticophila]
MRKKILIFGLIFVFLVIGGIFASLQIKYKSLEKSLKNYLISEQGYSESDILSVKAKLSKMPQFPVYVRFADDPDTVYIFTDRGASDWTQVDPSTPQRLRKEVNMK